MYVSLFIGVQMKNSWSIAQHSTNIGRLRESLGLTKNNDQIIIRRTKKVGKLDLQKYRVLKVQDVLHMGILFILPMK